MAKPSPPQYLEVHCRSSGRTLRFAPGTESGFALSLINRNLRGTLRVPTHIEAVKDGEEAIAFGPNSILSHVGEGWKLQTVSFTQLPSGNMHKRAHHDTSIAGRAAQPIPGYIPENFHDKYRSFQRYHYHPTRYLDPAVIATYGMTHSIYAHLQRIGWTDILELRHPTFVQPTIEFLATCTDYEDPANEEIRVRFYMAGHQHDMTLAEFNVRLGFYTAEYVQTPEYKEALLDTPEDWVDAMVWRELTGAAGGNYNPSTSKASRLRDPIVRTLHRWISRSVHGRAASEGVVTRGDLFILWCMTDGVGHLCNPGMALLRTCFNAGRRLSIRNRGHVVIGSFISRLAANLGYQPPEGSEIVQMEAIGRSTLTSIGVLRRDQHGVYHLIQVGEATTVAAEDAGDDDDEGQQMANDFIAEELVQQPPPLPPAAELATHPHPQHALLELRQHYDQRLDRMDGCLDRLQQTQASILSILQQLQLQFPPPPPE